MSETCSGRERAVEEKIFLMSSQNGYKTTKRKMLKQQLRNGKLLHKMRLKVFFSKDHKWKSPGMRHTTKKWLNSISSSHNALTIIFSEVMKEPGIFPNKSQQGLHLATYKIQEQTSRGEKKDVLKETLTQVFFFTNFAKFSRIPFLKEHICRLLLKNWRYKSP